MAVEEVIQDLRQEVHQQQRAPAEVADAPPRPAAAALVLPDDLDDRLNQIERSITRLIPLVRKILYTVSSGQEHE